MSSSPLLDLSNPQALEELYPLLAQLRQNAPVVWVDQLHCWIVTRHADVAAAFRNPALSSQRVDVILDAQLGSGGAALAPDYMRITRTQMLFRDGSDHHRLRVLGNRGFTPSMLEHAQPLIQQVIDGLVDQAIAARSFDLVTDFSQPLPALVIAELFDIPEADRAQFQAWADDVIALTGFSQGDPAGEARRANEGMRSLEAYFLQLLPERRQRPGRDLISLMLAGEADGRLSPEEVCSQCILILVAGHVTTIDQMSNAVHALLQHRDQWDMLCANPRLAASAVEEALRYDSAVCFVQRKAIEKTQVGEQEVQPGQAVWLCTAAANRDPAMFPDPDRFVITRPTPCHLAFGAGPHVCLGAGLARRELELALATLCRRLPQLRLDESRPAARRFASLIFRGFHSLPVRC